jgi:predicted secreted protein
VSADGIIEVGESENGREIELHVQQILRVSLGEVRTSGFRWTLRMSGAPTLTQVADEFESPTEAAGGIATHRWDFRAEDSGAVEIKFEYGRPWERAAAAPRSVLISVRVVKMAADAAAGLG